MSNGKIVIYLIDLQVMENPPFLDDFAIQTSI